MAKANQKTQKEKLQDQIQKGFEAFDGGLNELSNAVEEYITAAKKIKMDLLAKSLENMLDEIELARDILAMYQKGWERVKEQ